MTTPGIRRIHRIVRVDRPAAGQGWTLTPGGARWWRVISLTARLVTSAVVANRRVRLTATEGDFTFFVAEAHLNQAASLTFDYTAHTGAPVSAADNLVLPLPLPSGGLLLRSGAVLTASATALDAGDQWSAIAALVEELPSGRLYEGDELTEPVEQQGV